MITERDRILAAILALSHGPVEGQAEAAGWTPEMVAYGNLVLLQVARAISANQHHMLSDSEVKRLLAEGGLQ